MNREAVIEKSEALNETNERRIVHIMNPVSGGGRKYHRVRSRISDLNEDIYLTKKEGDCEDFVAELLTKDPTAHIVVHGGDGTMGEAVGGIMASGAGKTSLFTGVPSGSGNDFLHYMREEKNVFGKVYPTDVIRANGRYSINIINMGFDCSVVSEAEKIRKIPGLGGGFSYILGVISTVVKKESFKTTITLEGIEGHSGVCERIKDDFLLVALANGRYYGGGFKVAPLAECDDGYIDVLAARNVTVMSFAALVADFKKGAHIDPKTGKPKDRFKDVAYYRRCKKVSFDGIKEICYDGNIFKDDKIEAEAINGAIMYTPPKKAWL